MTRGYGSMDYEHADYRSRHGEARPARHGESVDAFSCIVHRDKAGAGTRAGGQAQGSHPHQQYQVASQAAIGGKIVARETVSAFRQGRDGEMLWQATSAQTQAGWKNKRKAKNA